jgi:hypothetical protein
MSKTTQSVILNLNKDYANSKAHDFLQPVSQKFDIGKNAEVSLYNCKLTRKPIFIEGNSVAPFQNECDFKIDMEYFPSKEQRRQILKDTTNVLIDPDDLVVLNLNTIYDIQDLDFTIKSQAYTTDEFGIRISQAVNTTIIRGVEGIELKKGLDGVNDLTIGGSDAVLSFPYQYIYDREKFYMGFAGKPYTLPSLSITNFPKTLYSTINNCQNLGVSPLENTENFNTTNMVYTKGLTDILQACKKITSTASVSHTTYADFSRVSDSPIFPLFKLDNPDMQNNKYQQTQSFFEFDIHIDTSQNTYDYDMVMGFTNTYLQSNWTTASIPEEDTIQPSGEDVPEVLIGAKFVESKTTGNQLDKSKIDIYVPTLLTQRRNFLGNTEQLYNIYDEGLQKITTIDLLDGDVNDGGFSSQGKFGFRFVAHTNQSNSLEVLKRQTIFSIFGNGANNFERVYSFQFYGRPKAETDNILYDSAKDNIYFPANLIETGFMANCVKSDRTDTERTMLGMMPYMFVKKMSAGDGITNPRGNFILQKNFINSKVSYRVGLDYYNYNINNTSLNNVLGLEKKKSVKYNLYYTQDKAEFHRKISTNNPKRFDANSYPEYLADAGLTKLYTDNIQYNIELNLPISAFNTTKPTQIQNINNKNVSISNLGQKRAIVYKTPSIIEGETSGVNQTFISVFNEPNNLKQLTLNNSNVINLNEMNVKVRRSDTNELATELEDCSVELLITSDN